MRALAGLIGWDERAGGTFTLRGNGGDVHGVLAARAHAMPNAWQNGIGATPRRVVRRACALLRHARGGAAGARHSTCAGDAVARVEDGYLQTCEMLECARCSGNERDGGRRDGRLDRHRIVRRPRGHRRAVRGARSCGFTWTAHTVHRRSSRRRTGIASRLERRALARMGRAQADAHAAVRRYAAGPRNEADLARRFRSTRHICFTAHQGRRVWDQGTRSFLCSRTRGCHQGVGRIQRYGMAGIAALYDLLCEICAGAPRVDRRTRNDFVAMHEPETNILCFRWVGDGSLRRSHALDSINLDLRMRYNRHGARLDHRPRCSAERRVLRVTVMNPRTTRAHLHRDCSTSSRASHSRPAVSEWHCWACRTSASRSADRRCSITPRFAIERGERVCLLGRNGAGRARHEAARRHDRARQRRGRAPDRDHRRAARAGSARRRRRHDLRRRRGGTRRRRARCSRAITRRVIAWRQTRATRRCASSIDCITRSTRPDAWQMQYARRDGARASRARRRRAVRARVRWTQAADAARARARARARRAAARRADEPPRHRRHRVDGGFLIDRGTHARCSSRTIARSCAAWRRASSSSIAAGSSTGARDYDAYLERKEAALEAEAREWAEFDKKLAKEEVWIRTGIQARRTRNEGRVRALEALRVERGARRERMGTVQAAGAGGRAVGAARASRRET